VRAGDQREGRIHDRQACGVGRRAPCSTGQARASAYISRSFHSHRRSMRAISRECAEMTLAGSGCARGEAAGKTAHRAIAGDRRGAANKITSAGLRSSTASQMLSRIALRPLRPMWKGRCQRVGDQTREKAGVRRAQSLRQESEEERRSFVRPASFPETVVVTKGAASWEHDGRCLSSPDKKGFRRRCQRRRKAAYSWGRKPVACARRFGDQ